MSKEKITLKKLGELLVNPSENLLVEVYDNKQGRRVKVMKAKKKNKYTLNELGSRMDRFETKLDQIGDALFEFIKTTNERFDRIETRIDGIDARIDGIDARLDYNNLKKLPTNNK